MKSLRCLAWLAALAACESADAPPPGDTDAPTVDLTWPADQATVTTARPTVIVTFDEAIDPATVGDATLTLRGASAVSIPVDRTVASTAIAIAPRAALLPGTYRAELAAGVADVAGNALAQGAAWSFVVPDDRDHTPPRVVFVDPPAGATGVPVDAVVRVFFDEPIVAGPDALALVDAAGTPVPVAITSLETGLAATPTAPLAPAEHHQATATITIADRDGNALTSPSTWAFDTVAATTWAPPVRLEQGAGNALDLTLAVGGPSDVIAAWVQVAPAGAQEIWASRASGGAWSGATRVATTPTEWARFVDVGLDAAGAATAIWVSDLAAPTLRLSRQPPAQPWSPDETLVGPIALGAMGGPRLAVARATGAAAVAWQVPFADGWRVRTYDPTTGWGAVEVVPQILGGWVPTRAELAMSDAGDLALVWNEPDGGLERLTAATRTATGWSPTRRLGAAFANAPRLAMNPAGQAVVVWGEPNSPWAVWAQPWSPAAGWGTPTVLDATNADAQEPVVAVSADGSAMAAWTEWTMGRPRVVARHRTTTGTWETPAQLDAHPDGAHTPAVAIGDDGAAVVAWARRPATGAARVWAARYTTVGGWARREPIAAGAAPDRGLAVAVGRDGVATVAWLDVVGGVADVVAAQHPR